MYCKKCGKQLSEGANFCTGCGEKVGVDLSNTSTKSDTKRIMTIILAACIFLFGIIGICVFGNANKVTVIGEYENGLILLQCKDKYGVMDYNGNIVEPCIYDEIRNLNGTPQGKINETWVQINYPEGKNEEEYVYESIGLIKSLEGETIERIGEDRYLVYASWDFRIKSVIDGKRNTIKDLSNFTYYFSEILIADSETCVVEVTDNNGYYGLLDTNGEEIAELKYREIGYLSGKLISAAKEDGWGELKYGYLNVEGSEVIPFEYDVASEFSEGKAAVAKVEGPGGGFQIVGSEDGKPVFQYYEGTLKYGYINTLGEEVVPFIYTFCGDFSEGLAMVMKYNSDGALRYGYINKEGEEVTMGFDNAMNFADRLAAVAEVDADGYWKYGFINKMGEIVIPLEFESTYGFSEGLAAVAKKDVEGNEKWGYINTEGEMVIPFEYDYARSISNGLAKVGIRCADDSWKWGYINTEGEMVIPFEYDYASSIPNGLAEVGIRCADDSWKWGYVNKSGKEMIPTIYDYISENELGITLTNSSGNICCINPMMNIDDNTIDIGELRLAEVDTDGNYLTIMNSKEELIVEINKEFMKCEDYYKKAVNYYEEGKMEKAIRTLEKAIQIQPENNYLQVLKMEWTEKLH